MASGEDPIGSINIYSEGPLDDPGSYCCKFMEQQLDGHCREAKGHVTNTVQCPDQIICYDARDNSYMLSPLGAGAVFSIRYCPSCGNKLSKEAR